MKRLRRWLFNFAAAVSLLLCIVLVVLGIRSFWKVASLEIDHRSGTRFWVEIERGRLAVWKQRSVSPATKPARVLGIGVAPATAPGLQLQTRGERMTGGRPENLITESVLGFGAKSLPQANFDGAVAMFARLRKRADEARSLSPSVSLAMQGSADSLATIRHTDWQVTAPMWAPVAMTLILPTLWVIRWRRQRARAMLGMCAVCGYDLRATPDRCPECGAIPEGAKGAAA